MFVQLQRRTLLAWTVVVCAFALALSLVAPVNPARAAEPASPSPADEPSVNPISPAASTATASAGQQSDVTASAVAAAGGKSCQRSAVQMAHRLIAEKRVRTCSDIRIHDEDRVVKKGRKAKVSGKIRVPGVSAVKLQRTLNGKKWRTVKEVQVKNRRGAVKARFKTRVKVRKGWQALRAKSTKIRSTRSAPALNGDAIGLAASTAKKRVLSDTEHVSGQTRDAVKAFPISNVSKVKFAAQGPDGDSGDNAVKALTVKGRFAGETAVVQPTTTNIDLEPGQTKTVRLLNQQSTGALSFSIAVGKTDYFFSTNNDTLDGAACIDEDGNPQFPGIQDGGTAHVRIFDKSRWYNPVYGYQAEIKSGGDTCYIRMLDAKGQEFVNNKALGIAKIAWEAVEWAMLVVAAGGIVYGLYRVGAKVAGYVARAFMRPAVQEAEALGFRQGAAVEARALVQGAPRQVFAESRLGTEQALADAEERVQNLAAKVVEFKDAEISWAGDPGFFKGASKESFDLANTVNKDLSGLLRQANALRSTAQASGELAGLEAEQLAAIERNIAEMSKLQADARKLMKQWPNKAFQSQRLAQAEQWLGGRPVVLASDDVVVDRVIVQAGDRMAFIGDGEVVAAGSAADGELYGVEETSVRQMFASRFVAKVNEGGQAVIKSPWDSAANLQDLFATDADATALLISE